MRATHVSTLAAMTLLTAACTVGPDYERPDIDAGRGWAVAPSAAGPAQDLERWWRTFADPTLDRLVTTALDQNLEVREAGARVAEVRALRAAAAGGRYPAVNASAGVTRRRQSENGPIPINQIPGIERDQTIYELGFDAGWEIDVFGRTRRAVEAADARLDAAIDRRHGVELAIAAETARSYFELRGARHELEALRAAIAASTKSAELVEKQHAAGEVPEAAVAQAQAELASITAGQPLLEAKGRIAALSIGVLLGELPESELGLLDTEASGYVALKPVPVGERADILRRRPDVSAAERSLAAATADVGVATAELFPKIGIGANGGFQALDASTLFESTSQALALAPLISWRIFDGGRVRAQIHASEARVEIAALKYEQAVKEALTDAERALTLYSLGLTALDEQATAVAAARRSYGFATERYRAGDISLLELLDAERALRRAEETYAQVHTQAATDLVALFKALGGGWSL
jgi:NodT family efflux transporter outer membrane factor (OMF) lipoprotein